MPPTLYGTLYFSSWLYYVWVCLFIACLFAIRHMTLLCSSFSVPCPSVLPPPDWAVPQSSRLKYRQLFNSHDKMMSGHLTGMNTHTHTPTHTLTCHCLWWYCGSVCHNSECVTFDVCLFSRSPGSHYPNAVQPSSGPAGHNMVSTLKFNHLIFIKMEVDTWKTLVLKIRHLFYLLYLFRSLSDIDQDGKLTAEEFILAMHLIDMAMSGLPLPPVLPPDYLPPTFR